MPTIRKQVSFEVYTPMHVGPCIIELMEPGRIRVAVATAIPGAASLAYHILQYPAGRFVYTGNETVHAMGDQIDKSPYAVVTSDESKHLVSQGKAYRVSGKISNLSAYGSQHLLIKVPADVFPHIQRTRINSGGGDIDIGTYEDPTITADGTLAPALNLDRNSSETADMEVYIASTLSDVGSNIDTQWIPPTSAGIGQRLDDSGGSAKDEDWVLKEDTNYVVYFTNNSPEVISLWFELLWYEL